MSTANFYTQENFGLYIQVYEPMSMEEYKANEFHYDDYLFPQYLEAEDEEDEEYILEESYNHAMKLWEEDFYTDITEGNDGFKKLMDDFNNTLTFHKLGFKFGYYDGVQIFVDETAENPHDLDNDDCRYYYSYNCAFFHLRHGCSGG